MGEKKSMPRDQQGVVMARIGPGSRLKIEFAQLHGEQFSFGVGALLNNVLLASEPDGEQMVIEGNRRSDLEAAVKARAFSGSRVYVIRVKDSEKAEWPLRALVGTGLIHRVQKM